MCRAGIRHSPALNKFYYALIDLLPLSLSPSLPPSLPSSQVALDFHKLRDRAPYLFLSPALNKFYYALMGLRDFFVRSCKNLPEKVELWCDGTQVILPPQTESFIVLNINSHAGGVELWPEYPMGGGMEG